MMRIEVLPASFGDCILIEYGTGGAKRRVLIDAGLKGTYKDSLAPRLKQLGTPVDLELLVVTHIDRDHICGILPLLEENPAVIKAKDIWFNGRGHLDDGLGPADGEALGKLLKAKGLPWNEAFQKKAVVVPETGDLPRRPLADGATLTLLSPYRSHLTKLAAVWDDDTLGSWDEEDAAAEPDGPDSDVLGKRPPLASIDVQMLKDLSDADFEEDEAEPNGSSIAFLFEYDGKRVLFGADAFPSALLRSLKRLGPASSKFDAFKLPHHGSMNNCSPELLSEITCSRFLVSSNGGSFGHPHPETLAWIVTATDDDKTIHFNYSSDYTTVWDEATTRKKFSYAVEYPADAKSGLVLEL
jgi:beta-lactamase superfamily II metal-dependent hydrolase